MRRNLLGRVITVINKKRIPRGAYTTMWAHSINLRAIIQICMLVPLVASLALHHRETFT